MNSLSSALRDYVSIRRNLGFHFRLPASLLKKFVAFLEGRGASYITAELALCWATQPERAQPATWAWRLAIVRRFASWLSATDPRTEVPPLGLLAHRYRRKHPHIYTDSEIKGILTRAQQLPSCRGLRANTYTTLFGLLAVTGMRVNEALGLDRKDVDLVGAILYIRRAKFGKSRYVPIHRSTARALKNYAAARDRIICCRSTDAFFVSEQGNRISEFIVRTQVRSKRHKLGLVLWPADKFTIAPEESTSELLRQISTPCTRQVSVAS